MKKNSWPFAAGFALIAISFACLPHPQRQYLQHDAIKPAMDWLTARAQRLEQHLQKFPALGAAESRLRAQYAQLKPVVQDMLDRAVQLAHQVSSSSSGSSGSGEPRQQPEACKPDEVAACRMSGQVCVRVCVCVCVCVCARARAHS